MLMLNTIGKLVSFHFDINGGVYVGELVEVVESVNEQSFDKNGFNVKIKTKFIHSFPLPGMSNRFSEQWITNLPLQPETIIEISRMRVERYKGFTYDYDTSYEDKLSSLYNDLRTLLDKVEGEDLTDTESRLQRIYDYSDMKLGRAMNVLRYLYNRKFEHEFLIGNPANSIGTRLSSRRITKGYSLANVYEITNVLSNDLERIENDLNDPSIEQLMKLSDIYNVSIDWIINGENYRELETRYNPSEIESWKNRALESETKLKELKDSIKLVMSQVYETTENRH